MYVAACVEASDRIMLMTRSATMTPTAASFETVVAPLRVMVFRRSVHVHTSIKAMVRVASIPSVVASVDGPSGSDNGVKTH